MIIKDLNFLEKILEVYKILKLSEILEKSFSYFMTIIQNFVKFKCLTM